jgi:hypothetical protein
MDALIVIVIVILAIVSIISTAGVIVDEDQRKFKFGYALPLCIIGWPVLGVLSLWFGLAINSWHDDKSLYWETYAPIKRDGPATYATCGEMVVTLDGDAKFVDVNNYQLKLYGREGAWKNGIYFEARDYTKIVPKEVEAK